MARTLNTMPYMVQRENLGRDWHECVSQRDLHMVSEYRKIENRKLRRQNKAAIKRGDFDGCVPFRRNIWWLAS